MSYFGSGSPDDIASVIAALGEFGRDTLDWTALSRAAAENRRECAEQRLDRRGSPGWFKVSNDHEHRLDPPIADAEVLSIRLNTLLLATVTRFGQDWQKLIERRAPEIRRCLEDFQATEDPPGMVRSAVILQLRLLFEELGVLVLDQGKLFERDLRNLKQDELPYPALAADAPRRP